MTPDLHRGFRSDVLCGIRIGCQDRQKGKRPGSCKKLQQGMARTLYPPPRPAIHAQGVQEARMFLISPLLSLLCDGVGFARLRTQKRLRHCF